MTMEQLPKRAILALVVYAWSVSAWSSFHGPALSRPSRATLKHPHQHERSLVMKSDDSNSGFSLGNLFGGSGNKASSSGAATATNNSNNLRGRGRALEPHPSVRPHISPLNRLGPDFDSSKLSETDPLPMHADVTSGTLPNGFSYVILPNKSPPGRFEAHLQVFSGSGTCDKIPQSLLGCMLFVI